MSEEPKANGNGQAPPTDDGRPVAEALRAEILRLAREGDPKTGGALTAEVLLRIMRVAKTGRELLVSLTVSPANLAALVRKSGPGGFIGQFGDSGDSFGEDSSSIATIGTPIIAQNPLSGPTSPAENFGMTALREMIAAAKSSSKAGDSVVDLVEALALARERGLDDAARELEARLGIGKEDKTSAEVKSAK